MCLYEWAVESIQPICSKSLILSDSFIHSLLQRWYCFNISQIKWYDMIWLLSLGDCVSSGFAYIHWPEGRKSAVWFNSSNLQYVVLRLLRKKSRSEWDHHSSACGEAHWSLPMAWKSTPVTALDFKLDIWSEVH